MNFTGLAVLVLTGLVGLWGFPHFIEWKKSKAYTHAKDRESIHMRMVDTSRVLDQTQHIYGGGVIHPLRQGETMEQRTGGASRALALANARAQRAATLARRQAAAQRRLLLTIVVSACAVVATGLAIASVIAWTWVVVSAVVMAGVIALGTKAAHDGQKFDQEMEERIKRLEQDIRGHHYASPRSSSAYTAAPLSPSSHTEVPFLTHTAAADEHSQERAIDIDVTEGSAASTPATTTQKSSPRASVATASDPAQEASSTVSRPASKASSRDTSDPFGKPWTPMPVPKPSYSLKPLIQRRDLDTKALIKQQRTTVSARVPYRPTQPMTPEGVPLTSNEVAAGSPINLDVDEMIDHRRLAK